LNLSVIPLVKSSEKIPRYHTVFSFQNSINSVGNAVGIYRRNNVVGNYYRQQRSDTKEGCQVCRKVNDTKGLWRHSVRISRVNVLVSLHTQSFVRLIYFLYESRSSDFIFLYCLITYTLFQSFQT
jgi:hypothetical protein